MPELPLGSCFQAPRHEPEACPHDDAWRFSWCVDEPVTRERRGVRQIAVQTTQFIVCMACDTIRESVLRSARDWRALPANPETAAARSEEYERPS